MSFFDPENNSFLNPYYKHPQTRGQIRDKNIETAKANIASGNASLGDRAILSLQGIGTQNALQGSMDNIQNEIQKSAMIQNIIDRLKTGGQNTGISTAGIGYKK